MRLPQQFVDDILSMILGAPFLFFVATSGVVLSLLRTEFRMAMMFTVIGGLAVRIYWLQHQRGREVTGNDK